MWIRIIGAGVLAVTAGLGYPAGPLGWGERVGARRMLGLPLTELGTVPTDLVR